jgi:hypothetical protein
MAWNKQPKVERPEYLKMIPVTASADEAQQLLSSLLNDDHEAELVDGGERGVYMRVHNEVAEAAAKTHGPARSFPLA